MTVKSIVIRKRTLGLILLAVLGLGLLGWGVYGVQFKLWLTDNGGQNKEVNLVNKVSNPDGLNINLNELTNKKKGEANSEFFVDYRLQRERVRGQELELLREIINNPESSADTRKKAQDQLLVISDDINKEMEVENLIRAKGFKECVVFLHDQAVTVIVQTSKISSDEAARIADIVSRGTGVSLQNVVIIPKP